jgi:tRNA uridine 5-carboxymethylaminomethyl modification enzyme
MAPSDTLLSDEVMNQVEIQTKYKGYIDRQADQAERSKKVEDRKIPEGFIYKGMNGLSSEIVEKLEEVRPLNIGQASRIPGVTPAAVSLLMVAVTKHHPQ